MCCGFGSRWTCCPGKGSRPCWTCPAPPAWTAVGEFQPHFLHLLNSGEEPVLWETQSQEFTEIVCLQCTVLVGVSTTLCDPMDCSLPGSSIDGILLARILEWVAMPAFRGFPDAGIEPVSPALQANSLPLSHQGSPYSA